MSVSCECRVVRYRSLRRADPSSRGVLPSVFVSECDREATTMKRPWPTRGRPAMKKKSTET